MSQRISRREFVVCTAGALAGCATGRSTGHQGIIDTHTHFYDPSRRQGVPWPPKNDAVLYRTVLPAELRRIAEPLGVAGTVVVEASPWIEDNGWILELASKDPFIIGMVGHLKPGTPSFAQDLERFAVSKRFRGIRSGGWDIQLAPTKPEFMRDLGLLAERNLSLDVLGGPEQLQAIGQIASALPSLKIVINHCAGVRIDAGVPDVEWRDGIKEVARYVNVTMKVSGLAEGTGKEFSAPRDTEFYKPVLDALWQAFGEDRLIFGSNWPVCTRFAEYETVLQIVRPFFASNGSIASEKYFRTNAEKIYGVKVAI